MKLLLQGRELTQAEAALSREQLAWSKMDTCADERVVHIEADAWLDGDVPTLHFDRCLHAREDDGGASALCVHGAGHALAIAATQVARRYQRLWPRYNEASQHEAFARVLALHRSLHDRTLPLVRADYEHALDVWQWLLRLAPAAPLALQVAALFHDVERLQSEAERRIEQHADDYLSFKVEHARRGAAWVAQLLGGVIPACTDDVVQLVARHEQPDGDLALQLLNDADALSFFSLNSAGFLAYYGPEHTLRKVRYTLARLRPEARPWLATMRLEPFLREALAQAA